ncbi:outer membrane beta-barrel protein [candidate division KSB1 bacterium]
MKFRTAILLIVLAVFLFLNQTAAVAQELSITGGGELYMQNDNLDDGGGYFVNLNFKHDKIPVVLRMGVARVWTLGLTTMLASDNTLRLTHFEPSIVARINWGPVLQPFAGVGYSFQSISGNPQYADTLIVQTDTVDKSNALVIMIGTNVVVSKRVSMYFSYKLMRHEPTMKRHQYVTITDEHSYYEDKMRLDTAMFEFGLRFNIIKLPRFR